MTETIAPAAATTARASPFQGLMHYASDDWLYFFGREAERKIIAANLIASRLTILYGPSGVGKSSLLRAGVQHDLLELARANVASGRSAELLVVVYNGPWHGDPLPALDECIRAAVEELLGSAPPRWDAPLPPLDVRLAAWSDAIDAQLLIVLDQFEEYLLYADDADGRDLDRQLPLALSRADLDASFLISIREDAIAGLDRFKGRIPRLFDNYLRLDHLDRAAARAAIRGPIDEWNRVVRAGLPPIGIEDDLVETVLDQVRAGRVVVGQTGRGRHDDSEDATDRIETPHLQLVMEKLWDEDVADGMLLRATLDRLGGAEQIVLTRGRDAIDTLPEDEQGVLATIFDRLVTPSGTKIAHSVDDLAKWARTPPDELTPILEKLTRGDLRILRPVAPPPGAVGGMRYELFHDVLAKAILDWQARYEHEQAERALAHRLAEEEAERARAEEQAARDRRNAKRAFRGLVVAGVAALVAIALGIAAYVSLRAARDARSLARTQAHLARAQALAAESMTELPIDPHVSLRLAQKAVDAKRTPITEPALRTALAHDRIVAVLQGPKDSTVKAALAPDNRHAFTVGRDWVRVWDARTGKVLRTIGGKDDPVVATSLAGGGPRALTVAADGAVRIWSLFPVRHSAVFHVGAKLDSDRAAFSADGSRLALFVSDRRAEIRNGATGALTKVLDVPAEPRPFIPTDPRWIHLSPNGRIATIQHHDAFGGLVHLWDTRSGRELRALPFGHSAWAVAFSRDSGLVTLGSPLGALQVWPVTGIKPLVDVRVNPFTFRYGGPGAIRSAVISRDGRRIATVGDTSTARVWDLKRNATQLVGHTGTVVDAEFSPDGKFVVTAADDRTARIWDAASGRVVDVLRGHRASVTAGAYSADGTRIITASDDGTARIWNARVHGVELPHTDPVASAVFSPDGKRILTAGADGLARVWEAKTGRFLRSRAVDSFFPDPLTHAAYAPDGHRFATVSFRDLTVWPSGIGTVLRGEPTDVEFAPSGKLVVVAAGPTATIWDPVHGKDPELGPTGRKIRELHETTQVRSAVFSPDGRFVLTATRGGTAGVWSAATGRRVRTLSVPGGLTHAAYSHDGRRIVTAGLDRTARVWDAATGRQLRSLSGHVRAVTTAEFSADGTRIVTGSADRTVRVWDARTGELQAVLAAGNANVTSASFSPDGKSLVTASGDGTVHVYPESSFAPFRRFMQVVANQARVPLTPAEQSEYRLLVQTAS